MKPVSLKSILAAGALVLPAWLLAAGSQPSVSPTAVMQQTTSIQTVLLPLRLSFARLSGFLPRFGELLAIVVVGSLLAVGIAALAGRFLKAIRLERGAKRIDLPEILKKGGIRLPVVELITTIIFFLVVVATLITAVELYGLDTGALMGQLLSYVPRVVAALFVLTVGVLLARLVSGITTLIAGNVGVQQSALLGQVGKYAIVIVTISIALRELGLGTMLTDRSRDIVFGGLVLAVVLAFGSVAREKVEKYLNNKIPNK